MKDICIVSSCGGHLTEIQSLKQIYEKYSHFYVINDVIELEPEMKDKTYFIKHSERDFKFIYNLYEAYKILRKERPKIIFSTGAGPVVPFAVIGKLLFRTKIIYVETITRVTKPSMTGKIMYHLADKFYYQWEGLRKYFPDGIYSGLVL